MNPTQVKTTYNRNADAEEQITTGLLGSIPYKIIKRTDYGEVDNKGGRPFGVKYFIYVNNDQNQWVPASEQMSRQALISFNFIDE